MTQPPDENPDFLAKPVPPSSEPSGPPTGEQPPAFTQSYGAAPTSPYVPGPGGPGYAPYAAPGAPGYPFAQAHGGANVAMGLGIASVVCAVLTPVICVTMPGILTGPFAIVLGARAKKEMAQRPGAYNNEGAATAGLVTGIVGTVLGLLMIGLVVFVLGAIFSFGV